MSEKTRNPHVGSRGNSSLLYIARPSSPTPPHTAHNLFLAWATHRLNDPVRFFVLLASTISPRALSASSS
ncbi:hypothetical protein BDR22DRAFT_848887 [Usnea florida]